MQTVEVVLITDCADLSRTIGTAVRSVKRCNLSVVAPETRLDELLDSCSPPLLIYHVRSLDHTEAVLALVERIRGERKSLATLAVVDQANPRAELELLRRGVADVLHRPLDVNRIAFLIDSLTLRARMSRSPARAEGTSTAEPRAVKSPQEPGAYLWEDSGPLKGLMQQVCRVARLTTTILLTGETGTGKTRLARLIHANSPRSQQPFITVNCGAVTPSLVESELFGHARGAYTGADADRIGKFAHAGQGTMLIDEVESLPLTAQARLLRSVDERVFEPVGSNSTVQLDARLVFATNHRLEDEVEAGRFRRDLYYRLNVVEFRIPPLRERIALIIPLAQRFADEFAGRDGRGPIRIALEARNAMESYDWPGNVRELRNAMERAVAMSANDTIHVADLPEQVARAGQSDARVSVPFQASSNLQDKRLNAEISAINHALRLHSNNRLQAARELGISRVTLYKKLRKYGIH